MDRRREEVAVFVRQYGRPAGRHGRDPNDRRYDRKVEAMVKRMPPEELSDLLHGDEEDEP